MISEEDLNSMVVDYIRAKKEYEAAREKLSSRVNGITTLYNASEYNIGPVVDDKLGWDIKDIGGKLTVETCNGRTYYGEYGEDSRYIPVEDLKYDVLNKNGSSSKEWDILKEIIKKRIEEARKVEEKRRKAEARKQAKISKQKKEEHDRKVYERLKAKFEGNVLDGKD